MEVIYEDNHIIAVDKTCREIVQGDKTGDKPLSEDAEGMAEGEVLQAR